MSERRVIVFDLDGTLSDPREGVVKSFNYALERLGRPSAPASALTKYIGPPLREAFSELLETEDETLVAEGIVLFRRRYRAAGFRETRLYAGIPEILERLKRQGHRLYVATVKRPDTALNVVKHLGIAQVFAGIFGCDLTTDKAGLLRRVRGLEEEKGHFYMVGDRGSDIAAGQITGMYTVGVTWGFGVAGELEEADAVVQTPAELLCVLENPGFES